MKSLVPLTLTPVMRSKVGRPLCFAFRASLLLAGSLALAVGPSCAVPAGADNAPDTACRARPLTQPVVLQLAGIRCLVCIQSVKRALAHFPGLLDPQFDVPREQVRLRVRPGFDQYVELKKA